MTNVSIDIAGYDNELIVKPYTQLNNLLIKVHGEGNRIIIDSEVVIVSGEINIIGTNSSLHIGQGTTVRNANFSAVGNKSSIKIGKDCMLSTNVEIRNGDVHPIYKQETGQELNLPKDIRLGDHVWLGADVVILKGVKIGSGSIVGVRTLMTRDAPENSLSVGSPGQVVKTGVEWQRKR